MASSPFESLARRPVAKRETSLDLTMQAYANILDDRNAQQARQARIVGRSIGLPGQTVEANLPLFEQEKQSGETYNFLSTDDHLTRFTADPHNAAAVKDDLPSLAEMSAILKFSDDRSGSDFTNYMKRQAQQRRPLLSALGISVPPPNRYTFAGANIPDLKNAPKLKQDRPVSAFEGGLATIEASVAGAGRGVENFLADAVGLGDAYRSTDYYKKLSTNIDNYYATAQAPSVQMDAKGNWLGARAYEAAQSLEIMGLSVLTKRPIAAMGLQAGGQQYGDVRARGGTANEALASGAVTGGAESFFERYFGLGWMLGNFGKKATSKFVGGLLLREVPSEMATTAVQDLADAMVTGGAGWEGYKQQLPEDLLNTAASTALMVGALGGPHHIAQRLRPQAEAVQQIEQAAAGGEMLDRLAAAAEQSKVKKEDPDTLRDFIEQRAEATPVRNVYVPVEAVAQYMQSDAYKGELDRYEPQIAQAQATQGDVVIPVGDAVAHLAGTPAWEALREDMRVAPGGLSRKEATQKHEEIVRVLEQRGKEIAAEAQSNDEAATAATEVYTEVKNRLRVAGIDEKQADAVAQIYAARYEARAARMGGTPMEQFKRSKISFPGEGAKGKKGRAVAQSGGEFLKWFGNSKTTDETGKPLVVYRGDSTAIDNYAEGYRREPGLFFAAEKERAAFYGEPRSFYLKMENPLDVRDATRKYSTDAQFKQFIDDEIWEPYYEGVTDSETDEPYTIDDVLSALEHGDLWRLDGTGGFTMRAWRRLQEVAPAYGYDGLIAPDSGEGVGTGISYVVFDATQVKSTANEGAFDPNNPNIYKQGERGTTTFTSDGQKIIELFAAADRSTLLHETGHIWLEELKEDGGADWDAVQKWFKAQGHPVTKAGFIPTEAHELWARGVERYFMEGKAPSNALRSAFQQFKAWLLRIYGVVQNLQTPITPEIREVMDRLIATDEAIADARNSNASEPLFKSAEEAGMTEAEFADYQSRVSDARDEAYDALLYKTMEKLRRERTQEMRDARASVRSEVAQEINSQPQFRLLHLLRTGRWLGEPDREPVKVKLNAGWLIDNFGEGILDQLPRGMKIIAADGETGDVLAEMVGMKSGSEVVHALVGMRTASDELRARGETRSLRDTLIDTQVDQIMAEHYGDPLNDGTIEEEAIAAINSARQGEVISSEIRQLGKRRSVLGTPTPYQFAREWARRTVAAGHVRDVVSRAALQRYIRASNKAARAAEEAILKGDVDEAFRQKQAQLLNHALLAEAKAAADRVDKIVARMKKLAGRAAMKSVDPEYLDKIHMLLENYDFRARSERSIDEQESFQEWAERQRSRGFEVHIPPRLENRGDPYTRVSVEELDSLNDVVESLLKLGRTKQKLVVAKAERDFSEFRDEVMARLEGLPTRRLGDKPINENERRIAAAASELLKVETIIEELDGGKTGPLHDAIVVGSTNAENRRFALREKVLKPIADSYNAMSGKQRRRLNERVTIPELTWNTLNEGDPRIGQPVTVTRMELLAVLMNMGNLSNLEKLSKGERWPVETLRAVMNRELTKEDFDFAQKLWDQVEGLWSEIVETEREMAGVTPEKVVAAPLDTPHGTYRGGYWPVVYDPARWQLAEDLEGKQLDDMFGLKSGVATQKGHTLTRTGAFGPINLSIERVLFSHIEQVVTRIAFAGYARDVLRIVRDRSIRGMMDTKLGPEYRRQIEKWLARQVHEGAVYAKAARWWDGALRQLRINMTIAAMGLRFSTGIAQVLGLTASADRIGARWVGTGMKRVALDPRGMTQFAFSRSPELLHRTEAVNREIAELSMKMRQKHGWWTDAQSWAMYHIGVIDRYAVALPTWIGAHAKGISEGMTDEEASNYADKEVRQSQGAGREKDLSAFQSPNSEAMRFFSMFYTPWNILFNAQWQAARDLRKGDPRRAISVTFWWLLVSTLGDAMLSGDWPGDDDESWLGWMGRNAFFGLWGGIPLLRDFTNAVERKVAGQYSDYSQTPVTRVYEAVDKAFQLGKRAYKGEEIKSPIKQTGDLSATLLGVPTSQPGATAQFLWDVHEGKSDPKGISDWYFGLTKGKVPDDKQPKSEGTQL